MDQHEQDDLNARLRARTMNMPLLVTCTNCHLTYYQTSAAHVCAEWARGAKTMIPLVSKNHSERECSEPDCPCHEWVKRFNEHEPAARGEGERFGFVVFTGRHKILDYHKPDGQQIAAADNEDAARLIVRALNATTQNAALVEQRERLREALRQVRHAYNQGPDPQNMRVAMDAAIDYVDAALNGQKGGEG